MALAIIVKVTLNLSLLRCMFFPQLLYYCHEIWQVLFSSLAATTLNFKKSIFCSLKIQPFDM